MYIDRYTATVDSNCQAFFSSYNNLSGFVPKNSPKILEYLFKLDALTLPYKDLKGRVIQLFETKQHEPLGTMLDKEENVTIIPSCRIKNSLNSVENPLTLVQYLKSRPLQKWDIVFDAHRLVMTIWPHLDASGKYDNVKIENVLIDIRKRFENVTQIKVIKSNGEIVIIENYRKLEPFVDESTKGGSLNRFHYKAAQNEARGIHIPKKSGEPFKHRMDVYEGVRAAKNTINDLNSVLCRNTLKPDERKEIENWKAKISKTIKEAKENIKWNKKEDEKYIQRGKLIQCVRKVEKIFHEMLQKTGLVKSYLSSNPNSSASTKGGPSREIGGVGCHSELIEGLFDKPGSLFDYVHSFFIPTEVSNELPFSDQELGQILYELAIGIYVHDTIPFFSLHFNEERSLYPVIHPIYEKTLVGQVFSLLDYEMKGYLNGGIFEEDFVKNWAKNPTPLNEQESFSKLINLEDYAKVHLKDETDKVYISVRDLTEIVSHLQEMNHPEEEIENPIFRDHTKFTNTIRIIAKQNKIQKEEDLFVLDSDFDVEYTISPDPDYKKALEEYHKIHGCYPPGYLVLIASFEKMKERIHDHMVKMPFCKKYFSMLKLINFLSYYFRTLKKHRKIPLLPKIDLKNCESPALFPSLPLKASRKVEYTISPKNIISKLILNNKDLLISYLRDEDNFQNQLSDVAVRLIWKDIYSNSSKPVQRRLEAEQSSYLSEFKKIAQFFIKKIINQFDSYINEMNGNRRRLEEEDGYTNIQDYYIRTNIYSNLFIEKLPNNFKKTFSLPAISTSLMILPEEQTSEELEKKNIVGGCGMFMNPMKIQKNLLGKDLLNNFWNKIEDQPLGQFILFSNEQSSLLNGIAFSLRFEDIPFGLEENPLEMETLFRSMIENESTGQSELGRILQIMSKNKQEKFICEINQHDLCQTKDAFGRTLLHYSVTTSDTFYTTELLKRGYSALEKDQKDYLPIHYAAMCGSVVQLELLLKVDSRHLNAQSNQRATPLIVAIQNGQLEAVKFLLSNNARADVKLIDGYTVLHCAVHAEDESIIKVLLENSEALTSINATTNEGITPLMLACQAGISLIPDLVGKGANPKLKAKNGMTALDFAVKRNEFALCKYLFPLSNLSSNTIETAIRKSSLEINILLSKSENYLYYCNSLEDTPLHLSLRYGNLPVAQHLLTLIHDATKLLAKNKIDESPMQLAAQGGFYEIVEKILELEVSAAPKELVTYLIKGGYRGGNNGLDQYIKEASFNEQQLQELLLIAAEKGNYLAISNILIPKGVDVDQLVGTNEWKIEHYLAKADAIYLFNHQWKKNRDLFSKDQQEKSLAYIAAENGSWRVFFFLLDILKKQRLPLTQHDQDRHLFYGVLKTRNLEGIKRFIEKVEDPQLPNQPLDAKGTYPVHMAAKMKSTEVLSYLHHLGANLESVDQMGYDALFYTIQCQNKEGFFYLVDEKHAVSIKSPAIFAAAKLKDTTFLTALIPLANEMQKQEALMLAIQNHHLQATLCLLNHPISVNFKNANGWSPFLLACREGLIEICKTIFPKVQNPFNEKINENNALDLATKWQHEDCIKFLKHNGFTISQENTFVRKHENSRSKIIQAIDNQDIEIIKPKKLPFNSFFCLKISGKPVKGTLIHLLLKGFPKSENLKNYITSICSDPRFNSSLKDESGNSYAHLMLHLGLDPTEQRAFDSILKEKNRQGITPLHLAAQGNSLDCLKNLLEKLNKSDLNPVDDKGQTPLFYAILNHKTRHAAALIERGADLNQEDHEQLTPLFIACYTGNYPIVRYLVNHGADINQRAGLEQLSPLAASLKYEEIALFLVNEGAKLKYFDEDSSLAGVAARKGKDTILRFLAAKDYNMTACDKKGMQPIHHAAMKGKIKTLSLLDSLGVSIDTLTSKGSATPLHLAAMHGTTKTVDWLLKKGANPEKVAEGNFNILTSAFLNTPGMSKELLNLFKEYSLANDLKQIIPAIKIAIAKDSVDSLKMIYDLGIPIDSQIDYGMNGLHRACIEGSLFSTSFFLKNGLDWKTPTQSGKTALELAAVNNSVEQFRFLVQHTVPDLDSQNKKGETLLHHAVKKGNLSHTAFLIDQGADFDIQDIQGKTPLFIAVEKEHIKIAALLMLCQADATLKTTFNSLLPEEIANREIRDLLEKIRNLQNKAPSEGTPLHIAVQTEYHFAVKLIARHVNVDQQNDRGRTALHEIADQEPFTNKRQLQNIREILKRGADINIKDNEGNTPLDLAKIRSPLSPITQFLTRVKAKTNDLNPISQEDYILAPNGIKHKILQTKPDGNCLMHAIFGNLQANQIIALNQEQKRSDIVHGVEKAKEAKKLTSHETLKCIGPNNEIGEDTCNLQFLSDSLAENGKWLGLEHAHLIARLFSLNIYVCVYSENTRQYVELFCNEQSNQIDHLISYNGRDHWSQHQIVIEQQ